ncbi:MAG: hypothetical protein JXA99_04425 [Candidatus Lokiarchaeota archaeon]|nr:hypothetical protein [Candidatus Lokiarchaeota archaeon]
MSNKIKKSKYYGEKSWYLFKLFISVAIGISFLILFIFVHGSENVKAHIIFSEICLDLAIILIPLILYISRVINNYKNNLKDFYELKQKLVILRHKMAGEKILKDYVISPLFIEKTISLLRRFNLKKDADIFRYIMNDKIVQLDDLIKRVLEKSRKLDYGKEYNIVKHEVESYADELMNVIEHNSIIEDLDKKFRDHIGYILAYELWLKPEDKTQLSHYHSQYLMS